jgi:hypothetical protein
MKPVKPPNEPPQGERFSHVYLDRGEPTGDSQRMRHRIGALIGDFWSHSGNSVREAIERSLGTEGHYGRSWPDVIKQMELRDVLDLITVAYRLLQPHGDARSWRDAIQEVFDEENVHYRVDEQGGVHFYIDKEFAHNSAATIACLQPARYANALHAFEGGQASLSKTPPDGKGAIRGTFGALEAVFRLLFPRAPKLTAQDAEGRLRPLVQQAHARDPAASSASGRLLTSFKEWVDAAHVYRHEQGVADIVAQPPLTLAIYMVSCGAAHLRWLAELDSQRIGQVAGASGPGTPQEATG